MTDVRVLITAQSLQPGGEPVRRLEQEGFHLVFNGYHKGRTEDELISLLPGIDAAIFDNDPVTARVLSAADRLKVIVRPGAGYDTIDVEAATARGIAVCPNREGRHAVAEYTMALILQCARKMLENLSEVRKGGWKQHMGRSLAGATVGIVGLGNIGKEVAQRARSFGMNVLAFDVAQDLIYAKEHQVRYVTLEQLLSGSDYVTIHTFLDARSHHLINAARLALMKPSAYLINVARGGLVDTMALYETLEASKIAGAALDVFEEEPLEAESPLRRLSNVWLAPHSSGATSDAMTAMTAAAAENVIRVLRGRPPIDIANPEVLRR